MDDRRRARDRHAGGRRRPRPGRWPAIDGDGVVDARPRRGAAAACQDPQEPRDRRAGRSPPAPCGLTVATIGEAEVFADGGYRRPVHRLSPCIADRARRPSDCCARSRSGIRLSVGLDSVDRRSRRSRRPSGAPRRRPRPRRSSRSTPAAPGRACAPDARRCARRGRAATSGSTVDRRLHPRRARLRRTGGPCRGRRGRGARPGRGRRRRCAGTGSSRWS